MSWSYSKQKINSKPVFSLKIIAKVSQRLNNIPHSYINRQTSSLSLKYISLLNKHIFSVLLYAFFFGDNNAKKI